MVILKIAIKFLWIFKRVIEYESVFAAQHWLQYTDWVTDVDDESKGAFLQWKPVCYNAASRSIASSMKTGHYSLANFSVEHYGNYKSGLAFAYFGWSLMNGTHMKASNLSFGGAGDDTSMFFDVAKYTSWYVTRRTFRATYLVIAVNKLELKLFLFLADTYE